MPINERGEFVRGRSGGGPTPSPSSFSGAGALVAIAFLTAVVFGVFRSTQTGPGQGPAPGSTTSVSEPSRGAEDDTTLAERTRVFTGVLGNWSNTTSRLDIRRLGTNLEATYVASDGVPRHLRGQLLSSNEVKLQSDQVGKLVNPFLYWQGDFSQETWIGLSPDGKLLSARFTEVRTGTTVVMRRSASVRVSVQIESNPSGAVVMLDGNRVGTTPTTVTFEGSATSAKHAVSLVAQDEAHETTNYWFVPSNLPSRSLLLALHRRPSTAPPSPAPTPPPSRTSPTPNLPMLAAAPPRGLLLVRAPQEVDVRLDGASIGRSDSFRIDVAPGTHRVEFLDDGLFVPPSEVTIQAGETTRVVLDPPASVRLVARPGNSEVWVAARRVGVTPMTLKAPAGVYQLEFRWPDGRTLPYQLDLRAGMSPVLVVAPVR